MRTNVKLKVTPEQSAKVQEICFENGIGWHYTSRHEIQYIDKPYLYIDADNISYSNNTSLF